MAEETLREFFDELLLRAEGLSAVFVNDTEGVPILQVVQPDTVADVEDTDSNRLTATFSLAVEQVSKLKLGKNSTTTAFFDNCVVIHVNFEPYVISLLAEPNANVGLISALIPDMAAFLEPIRARCAPLPPALRSVCCLYACARRAAAAAAARCLAADLARARRCGAAAGSALTNGAACCGQAEGPQIGGQLTIVMGLMRHDEKKTTVRCAQQRACPRNPRDRPTRRRGSCLWCDTMRVPIEIDKSVLLH